MSPLILLFIVAQKYDACVNKSVFGINSSINLINKLKFFLKSEDQRDETFNEQGTQKIKILN